MKRMRWQPRQQGRREWRALEHACMGHVAQPRFPKVPVLLGEHFIAFWKPRSQPIHVLQLPPRTFHHGTVAMARVCKASPHRMAMAMTRWACIQGKHASCHVHQCPIHVISLPPLPNLYSAETHHKFLTNREEQPRNRGPGAQRAFCTG